MTSSQSTALTQSEEWYFVFEFACGLCEPGSEFSEAAGYCMTCREYLCQDCYRTHQRPRPMRHHVLLGRDTMPRQRDNPTPGRDTSTEPCTGHPNEDIKYLCSDHDQFGCRLCMIQGHQMCRNVDYISDVAYDQFIAIEYKEMQIRIDGVTKSANKVMHATKRQIKHCQVSYVNSLDAIEKLRKDLNDAVDELEKTVAKQASDMREEDENKMCSLKAKCQDIVKEIHDIDDKLLTLKGDSKLCQMFIAIKRAVKSLALLETKLGEIECEVTVRSYTLKSSAMVEILLQAPEMIASLEILDKNSALVKMDDRRAAELKEGATSTKDMADNARNLMLSARYVSEATSSKKNLMLDEQQESATSDDHDEKTRVIHSRKFTSSSASEPLKRRARTKHKHERRVSIGTIESKQSVRSKTSRQHKQTERKLPMIHLHDIDISSQDDTTKNPQVTSCVLISECKLIVVDGANSAVKLIDLRDNNIASQLKLPGELWDIAQVGRNKVAVTAYDKIYIVKVGMRMLFVNMGSRLALDHEIMVAGQRKGIACLNDKLIVSFSQPVKIEIMDMKGHVLKTVVEAQRGMKLFCKPLYIAVGKDQETVYVSDYENNTVTSLDLCGKVKGIFKDRELRSPGKLTIGMEGVVYVCGYRSNTVHYLTPDLERGQELCQRSKLIDGPTSISFHEANSTLYIGTNQGHFKVFKIELSVFK